MSDPAPEVVKLTPRTVRPLAAMLRAVEDAGEADWFRPHPFAAEHLATLCTPDVRDLYYVLAYRDDVLAYGLLRGWDEGYAIPSLGIAVHPAYRGKGLGATMMHILHSAAQLRGSARVRLRVSRSNLAAAALYRRMGYQFEPEPAGTDTLLLTAFKDI